MNKIKFLVFIYVLCAAGLVNAQQQVSEKEIRNAAISTLHRKSDILRVSSQTKIKRVNSFYNTRKDTLMYEVIFENGSAVLLSGSKACLPVLGYYKKPEGDNGSIFDTNNMNVPPGLRSMLNGYAQEIEGRFAQKNIELYYAEQWTELQETNIYKDNLHSSNTRASVIVGPLLTTEWGQSTSNIGGDCDAYNYYMTATHSSCSCSSQRCPIGCTAVAMGQIMYYWKYPVNTLQHGMRFDWCNMTNKLSTSSPNYNKERNAIAKLLKDCADFAYTSYCVFGGLGDCNSFAWPDNARDALVHFGYSDAADFRQRLWHSNSNWMNYIKNDLNNGRPVLYTSISNISNAHTFVVDGYDSDDKFHFNWGWRGNYNDWFALDGLGSIGSTPSNFNNWHQATFLIQPDMSQDYCNFDISTLGHYIIQLYLLGIHSIYNAHQFYLDLVSQVNIPRYATRLTSAHSGIAQDIYGQNFTVPASWYTIPAGTTREYVAHESIVLKPGFHAQAGSNFTARIEPCNNCNNSTWTAVAGQFIADDVYQDEELHIEEKKQISNNHKLVNNEITLQQEHSTPAPFDFSIHPNPNEGNFTLEVNTKELQSFSIEIFNSSGVLVAKMERCNTPQIEVNRSDLPAGIYFVRVVMGTDVSVKKIVIN